MIDHKCGNRSCVNPDHLRLATPSQNTYNQKLSAANKSGYKGVSWEKGKNKWVAQIGYDNSPHFLGYFDTAIEAHAAYCAAAIKFHGEFANFGEDGKP